MNTRSPYPDVEIPDISLPGLVPDRAGERGAAVPLLGPADHASAGLLMGPATDLLVLLAWTAGACAFATWRFRWH